MGLGTKHPLRLLAVPKLKSITELFLLIVPVKDKDIDLRGKVYDIQRTIEILGEDNKECGHVDKAFVGIGDHANHILGGPVEEDLGDTR